MPVLLPHTFPYPLKAFYRHRRKQGETEGILLGLRMRELVEEYFGN